MDEETDLLASFLVAKGCGPGKVVGIMMNRCGAYVLGYIAAHKAGGAYMPIELAYVQLLPGRGGQWTTMPLILHSQFLHCT